MKSAVCGALGLVGTTIAHFLGGWDTSLATLVLFMALDYISGLIVAGVFKKSTKTETGGLESKTCYKGLFKKGMILVFVAIGCRLDLMTETNVIRDGVCITFIVSELISITENAGLMGIKIPPVILNAIDVLNRKEVNKNE